MDTRKWFIALLLLTILCGFVVAPIDKKPGIFQELKVSLGIDLVGGAELTYRILYPSEEEKEAETKKETPQKLIDILRKRIDQRGLKEPRINLLNDDQIVIQLAILTEDDLQDYMDLLKRQGKLEEREVAPKLIHERWDGTPENAPEGWFAIENNRKMVDDYAYLGGDYILVSSDLIITGTDIERAVKEQDISNPGQWAVRFVLTRDGGERFDRAAKKLFNQIPKGLTAIIVDGKIESKPTIQAEEFNGTGTISGNFTKESAGNLAIVLSNGQLPIQIGSLESGEGEPEAIRFIGPTLAQDSLSRGLAAAAVGLGLVILFLILYYRGAGFVAIFTLVCSLTYLMTIMSVFNATLTLPGLAGLVLTVGLAVDANILILERIREEMAKGKTALQAYESGHEKAFSAILDANITSLIAAGVLYYFGTGPVKGFAIVLSIGIITTMFSVLVIGKVLIRLLIQSGSLREFKMMRIWTKMNVNFVRIMPACIVISLLAVVAGAGIFSKRIDQSLGMDFRGGTRLSFRLYEESTIEEVRGKIYEILNANGKPQFPDAEVTAMAEDKDASATKFKLFATTNSHTFQVRSSTQDQDLLQSAIQSKFANDMSHVPFGNLPESELPSEEKLSFQVRVDEGPSEEEPAGAGVYVYLLEEGFDEAKAKKVFTDRARSLGFSRNNVGETNIRIEQVETSPTGLVQLRVLFAASDMEMNEDELEPVNLSKWRDSLSAKAKEAGLTLSRSPFESAGKIGPSVASDLKDSTIRALLVGWFLIIIYIAIRFASWKFGLAAVFALIHDGVIAMGVVALCGWLIPSGWGLSFEMNVVTVAALLTIVGYSVNDTIVLFDRIRENLTLLKRESFREIINTSVNQTMSRTLLTSFTTLMVVLVLYIFTMTSAGGVSEFAFPLIVGVLVGTYSSIYVASSTALWFFRGKKPQTHK